MESDTTRDLGTPQLEPSIMGTPEHLQCPYCGENLNLVAHPWPIPWVSLQDGQIFETACLACCAVVQVRMHQYEKRLETRADGFQD